MAKRGKYKGTSILQDEQRMGLEMIRGLSDAQRKQAIIKVGLKTENRTSAKRSRTISCWITPVSARPI